MPRYYKDKEEFDIIGIKQIQPYIENAESLDLKAFISLIYITGCRLIEECDMTNDDITTEKDKVKMRLYTAKRKDRKRRLLILNKNTPFMNIILRHWKRNENLSLFRYSKRTYQRRILELNKLIHGDNINNYITAHQLRHSRASYLALKHNATTWELRAWFGWKTSQPSDVYVMELSSERFADKIK